LKVVSLKIDGLKPEHVSVEKVDPYSIQRVLTIASKDSLQLSGNPDDFLILAATIMHDCFGMRMELTSEEWEYAWHHGTLINRWLHGDSNAFSKNILGKSEEDEAS